MICNRVQYKAVYKAVTCVYSLAQLKDIEKKGFQSHHLFYLLIKLFWNFNIQV